MLLYQICLQIIMISDTFLFQRVLYCELLLFYLKWAIFQLLHADEMMTSWIFIVVAHWYNSPMVDMSLHSKTNQSFLLLLNVACLAEK